MATDLETTLMRKVGLNAHWSYAENSECRRIRENVARTLPAVIQQAHTVGLSIALPNERLMTLLTWVAEEGEAHRETLQSTWEACAVIINTHEHLFFFSDELEIESIVNEAIRDILSLVKQNSRKAPGQRQEDDDEWNRGFSSLYEEDDDEE